MRKLFLMPFLAIALTISFMCCGSSAAGDEPTDSGKQYLVAGVAFYNLENLFDTINENGSYDREFSPEGAKMWNSDKYWKKIHNLATAISKLNTENTPNGPGIIGISEIENRSVIEDLVKEVDNVLVADGREPWGLQICHHDSPDRRGVDVGLLYNPLYFELKNVNNHRLKIDDNPDFLTRDQMVVTGEMFEKPISIIVNHWPSRLGGQAESEYLRVEAAKLSAHIADSLWKANPDMGVIVMGDLNDDPQNKSCAQTLGARRDREKATDHGFYNPFWWILDQGVGSLCYQGKWNLFDQIIVSGNLANGKGGDLQYWKATVHNMPMLRTQSGKYKNYPLRTFSGKTFLNGYSDHFPTQIFLVREF
ncbi:MAG: endonuclease/exonuclease/phosphatase family protein [Muribaculum sp.]|nr:endonuclease/exonuclease/phosphatase family protein [Muribaculaceae bacterium]MCM1080146.1 endonuclease/exonuclease/phosphatase family protein [Muribaculum sp.]